MQSNQALAHSVAAANNDLHVYFKYAANIIVT